MRREKRLDIDPKAVEEMAVAHPDDDRRPGMDIGPNGPGAKKTMAFAGEAFKAIDGWVEVSGREKKAAGTPGFADRGK